MFPFYVPLHHHPCFIEQNTSPSFMLLTRQKRKSTVTCNFISECINGFIVIFVIISLSRLAHLTSKSVFVFILFNTIFYSAVWSSTESHTVRSHRSNTDVFNISEHNDTISRKQKQIKIKTINMWLILNFMQWVRMLWIDHRGCVHMCRESERKRETEGEGFISSDWVLISWVGLCAFSIQGKETVVKNRFFFFFLE